jgi:translocation and assembly module TamB
VPQLTGQVRTERGQYRAWGQRLEIETGLLNFNGPYDNPTLELLALRQLPDQRVGVQLSGTALAPRLRLYADPDLPESEKLAWLVLGRPAGGTGAETALLQQAALALFSRRSRANEGGFQRSLGLDELSFQGETQRADGSAQAAALTLGKRISRQLYLSYSRSVVGTTGTVAILYDLARHLTLRAQAGDDNAIELIYTRQYDGRRARSSPAAPKAVDGAATMRGSSP